MSRKLFYNITVTALLTCMFFTGICVYAAPRDELLRLIDFGAGYKTGQSIVGQSDGIGTWTTINNGTSGSMVVEPKPPYDNVLSGNVLNIVDTGGGQIIYPFGSRSMDLILKGRIFINGTENISIGLYPQNNNTPHTQFNLYNGELRYTNAGLNPTDPTSGSGGTVLFSGNSRYTLPAGGEWANFEIKAFFNGDKGLYDRCDYYFSLGDTPPVLLTPSTANTVRFKFDNIGRLGIQAINPTSKVTSIYADRFEVWASGILDNLPAPKNLSWSGDTLNWEPVTDAVSYMIKLYKDGRVVTTLPEEGEPPITGTSFDLRDAMLKNLYGTYTAAVIAVANPTQDKDSLASDSAPSHIFSNPYPPLAKASTPVWNQNLLEWQPVTGAVSYVVDLYKGAVRVNTVSVTTASFDFETEMMNKGKGLYKAKVKAKANQTLNNDGEASEFSGVNNFDPESSSIIPSDETYCMLAANAVTEMTLSNEINSVITKNLMLPSKGLFDVSITWASNNTSVINNIGEVRRPATGKAIFVTLTGTFTLNQYQYEKLYKFIVPSLDPEYEPIKLSPDMAYKDSSDTENIFNDVGAEHWAKNYIEYLYTVGIVNGTQVGYFEPDRTVSREEVCKMLVNLLGLTASDSGAAFGDVPKTAWFYSAVSSAYYAELVTGISPVEFGAGANITRQDLAVMVVRAMKYAEVDLNLIEEAVKFNDENQIAGYAKDSITTLQRAGILSGGGDGNINPTATATRAETAKLICSLYIIIKR